MKTLPFLRVILIAIALIFLSACSGSGDNNDPVEAPSEPPADAVVVEPAAPAPATATVMPSPEPVATGEPTATVMPSPEPTATEIPDPFPDSVKMSLHAQKSLTQHSRPKAITLPGSLDDLDPPSEDSWRTLQPGEETEFRTYDGIRIREEGQAILDLGNQVNLIMKRDTTLQFVENKLAQEKVANLKVDIEGRLLEEIVLTLHLSRGGFFGSKEFDGTSIALSTPNAVVIVSGTDFFVAYDPERGITWVCNLGGTIDVADVAMAESQRIPDGWLIAIPDVRGETTWPVNADLTLDGFFELIDQVESPTGALDMISGAHLVGQTHPVVDVRSGAGVGFPPVTTLPLGDFARVIGQDGIWMQIVCPPDAAPSDSGECWVPGEPFTAVYNIDSLDNTSAAPDTTTTTAPAAPLPTATPPVSFDPKSLCISVETGVLGTIEICP